MTLSISLQLLGGGLEVVHVVIDPLEAVLRDRDTVDDLRQRRALRAGQQLPLAALISLGVVGIEAQRRDERVAETDVNEIRPIELYLDGKVIDLNLRPTAQHRCTESTNPEAKLLSVLFFTYGFQVERLGMGMTLAVITFLPLVLVGVALQRLQRRLQY